MSGLIFIIIIVVAVIKISSAANTTPKRTNPPVQPRPIQNGPVQNEHFQPVGGSFENEKQQLRERAEKRLAAKRAAENKSILQRAKASVAEDFAETETPVGNGYQSQYNVQQGQRELARKVEEKINRPVIMEADDNSDIMKKVEDLMVKGPDASIVFKRDFLAEGMDMLNRIQA